MCRGTGAGVCSMDEDAKWDIVINSPHEGKREAELVEAGDRGRVRKSSVWLRRTSRSQSVIIEQMTEETGSDSEFEKRVGRTLFPTQGVGNKKG